MSDISSQSSVQGRRKLRKGTRSCIECRKRKVRCTFPPTGDVCDHCLRRGKACIDQNMGRTPSPIISRKTGVRQRLERIDGMVSQMLRKMDLQSSVEDPDGSPQDADLDLQRLRLELFRSASLMSDGSPRSLDHYSVGKESEELLSRPSLESAPFFGLVNNTVLRVQHPPQNTEVCHGNGNGQHTNPQRNRIALFRLLRRLLPDLEDLSLIARATKNTSELWDEALPHAERSVSEESDRSLRTRIAQATACDNLATIVKLLFCLATCIQQLPTGFDYSQTELRDAPDILQARYLAAAESVLDLDACLAKTLDGLECMVLQSKYYVNMGRPRTAWLIGQRAISTSHLLGVHGWKAGVAGVAGERWSVLWTTFWLRDRQLSLLLGLPPAASNLQSDFLNMDLSSPEPQLVQTLWRNLGIAADHIIKRDQKPGDLDFGLTLQIDQKLDDLRQSMPSGWWDTLPNPQMPVRVVESVFLGKLMFHNTRKVLHLPFMLKSIRDRRYIFNRDLVLDSSREMIKLYQMLRDPALPLLSICNVEDFQVFTAVMAIIVYHLSLIHSGTDPDPGESERDWQLIRDTGRIFHALSNERGCSVAIQASRIVDDFIESPDHFPGTEDGVYRTVIPYFGEIKIVRQENRPAEQQRRDQLNRQAMGPALLTESALLRDFEFYPDPPFMSRNLALGLPPSDFPNVDLSLPRWPSLQADLDSDWMAF